MKLRILPLALLSLTFVACSSGGGGGGGGDDKKPSVSATDITDRKECEGPVPAGSTIEGKWYMALKYEDSPIVLSYDIHKAHTTLEVHCYYPNSHAAATVSGSSSYNDTNFDVFEEANSVDNSGTKPCSANISKANMTYKLIGNCLQLTDGDNVGLLVKTEPKL